MPRSSCTGELVYILEIEKTAHKLRKENRKREEEQSSTSSPRLNLAIKLANSSRDYYSDSETKEETMANNRVLKELAALDLNQQPLCITFPNLDENTTFKLKYRIILLLPSFHGFLGLEPHKYLQEFDVVCPNIKPPGIT